MEVDPQMMGMASLCLWWLVLLQGIVTLILGIMFLAQPFETLAVLVVFLGAYWFVTGIFTLIGLAVDKSNAAMKAILGVLSIIAGIVILAHPLYSALMVPLILITFIGAWAIVMGAISLYGGFKGGGWGSTALGILGIIFGIILLAAPYIALALLPTVLGIFGVAGGLSVIVASIMIHSQETKDQAPKGSSGA